MIYAYAYGFVLAYDAQRGKGLSRRTAILNVIRNRSWT